MNGATGDPAVSPGDPDRRADPHEDIVKARTSRRPSPREKRPGAPDAQSPRPIRISNPLPASMMRPMERRAEMCRILALGLVRLRQRNHEKPADNAEEFSLHYPPDQCPHATPTHRRTA